MSEIKLGENEFYMEEEGDVIARIQFTYDGPDATGKEINSQV